MPTIELPVPESYMSITRPVALGVVKSVIEMTGLPVERVMYNGLLEVDKDINSLIGGKREDHLLIRGSASNRVEVAVTERYDENYLINTHINQNEELSVFQDNALGVTVRPIYTKMDVTIEFSIRTNDYRTARSWLDDQKIKLTQGRMEHMHDVPFKYPMPKEYMLILDHIHKLREANAGYGETWDEWFIPNLTQRATVITKMDGTSGLLVFNEVAQGILGWWEFVAPPEDTKGDIGATRLITFTYRYQYQKPTHMSMVYPLVVHNQMLDLNYIGPEEYTRYGFMDGIKSISNSDMDTFRKLYNFYDYMLHGIRHPHYDEWYPFVGPASTATLATVLTRIAPEDTRLVLDLNELVDLGIRPEMLSYFSKYHMDLNRPTHNVFTVMVYRDGKMLDPSLVTVSEDLIVSTTVDLDLRKTYHLRIGMLHDLTILTEDALDKLRREPEVCLEILDALDPSLTERGLLPKVLGGRIISLSGLKAAIMSMIRYSPPQRSQAELIIPRVANFLIIAEKQRAII